MRGHTISTRSFVVAGILLSLLLLDRSPVECRENVRKLLKPGRRIKVEGSMRGEMLYECDEVEMMGDTGGSFSIEGIVDELDISRRKMNLSGVSLDLPLKIKIVDAEGDKSDESLLEEDMRINASFVYDEEGRIVVKRIKVVDSPDRDIEIKARLEHIFVYGRSRMELKLLDTRFSCDESTVFYDPEGEAVDFDFPDLDPYYRLVDNDEENPMRRLGFGSTVHLGGVVRLDLLPEKNLGLSRDLQSDVFFSRLSTRIELASKPTPVLDLFLKFGAQTPLSSDDPFHPNRNEASSILAEAFVLFREVFTEHLALKIGRQRFDEKREWLYNENLDALRLFVNFDPILVEMSVSKNYSENKERFEDDVNYILYSSYRGWSNRHLAFYMIHREDHDTTIEYDRRWYGVRSFGRFLKRFKYWMDLSFQRGERSIFTLRSYGYDVGITTLFRELPFRPNITFGYAYGSGDTDFTDTVDGEFRQTDFEGNKDKFRGVSSFKYYGEVLDPELSNLYVATAGLGFRWSKHSSFDIIYHSYKQEYADDGIHGSDLLIEPNGTSRDLGQGIDVVLGLEKIRNIDLELTVGFFKPGRAFQPHDEVASLGKFKVEYNF